jgi:asparagine synthase (glutamine-hydrolysing)
MEAVVERTGATPHYIFPNPEDVMARASDITWHQDEPFGSTSIFAQWCVFEEARRAGIKVMLDGQGADEQLAGYHASYVYYMSDLLRRRQYMMLARTIWERNRYHGIPVADQVQRYVRPHLPLHVARFLRSAAGVGYAHHDWLGSDVIRSSGNPLGAVGAATAALNLPSVTDIASLCVTLTYASNLAMLLHFEDRNSMAHSIEARVPFLDHPIVEFSLALGNEHKIVGGDTKRVLRRAMAKVLPDRIANRRDKLGFSTPEQTWFLGPLKQAMRDGVEATLKRFPGLLNAENTRAYAADMFDGRRPVDASLWRIENMGLWGERFRVGL